MARARIPYDYFDEYLSTIYTRPAFRQVGLVKNYYGRPVETPVRAYDRSTGNYKANGWFVIIEYDILIGIDNRVLLPEYEKKSLKVFIPDE